MNTNEFVKGIYDINFIDNLYYSGNNLEINTKDKEENEIAASVLAALIKTKGKPADKKNSSRTNNRWWEQNYE